MTDPADFLIRGRSQVQRVTSTGGGSRIYTWVGSSDHLVIPLAPGELASCLWAGYSGDSNADPGIIAVSGDYPSLGFGRLDITGDYQVGLVWISGDGEFELVNNDNVFIRCVVGQFGMALPL